VAGGQGIRVLRAAELLPGGDDPALKVAGIVVVATEAEHARPAGGGADTAQLLARDERGSFGWLRLPVAVLRPGEQVRRHDASFSSATSR
jgi:hypothetical protein